MLDSIFPTLRFARGWLRPPTGLRHRDIRVAPDDGSDSVAATLVDPPAKGPLPGWVVLHGITRPGRDHPSLLRFVRALASSGTRVLVPEVREWTQLDFAPERAQAIIRGAVDHMAADPFTEPGGVALAGFSFGAPQALVVGADPAFRNRLRGVVGWGGYSDLARTFLFQLTGQHGYGGKEYRQRPDPYGRWIVGANCLTLAPEFREATPVADALRAMAMDAGDRQVMAWDPSMERIRLQLRTGLPRSLRGLFDLFAPADNDLPDPEAARSIVERLVPPGRREHPLLEPIRLIEGMHVPVHLLHSRSDQLIPFTETRAMADALSRRAPDLSWDLTGLFAHSGGPGEGGLLSRLGEGARFAGVLGRVLSIARR